MSAPTPCPDLMPSWPPHGAQVVSVEFDRKDIEMNKLLVTTLESKFRVFDMRTQHPTEGFAHLTEKVRPLHPARQTSRSHGPHRPVPTRTRHTSPRCGLAATCRRTETCS